MAFITNAVSAATATLSAIQDGSQAVNAGAAQPLNGGTSLPCGSVEVENDHDSAGDVLVGNATSQSFRLSGGQATTITIDNVNKVYVKRKDDTLAATVNWR